MPHDVLSLVTLLCAGVLGAFISRDAELRIKHALVRVSSKNRR